jgi:hypothetical protein
MAQASPGNLTRSEWTLVDETRRDNLQQLDEDALVALHGRVRRARDKHVQLHRREVGAAVGRKGARGTASSAPRRSASKAEIFEDALARVSAALAKAARQSAAALRAERLAAARRAPAAKKTAAPRAPRKKSPAKSRPAGSKRPPIQKKAAAQGQRRQAKRDAARS